MSNEQVWTILGILALAIVASQLSEPGETTGFVVDGGDDCPEDKPISVSASDSSSSSDPADWTFSTGSDNMGDALEACKAQGNTQADSECADHCNGDNNDLKCDPDFTPDPNENGKATSFTVKTVVGSQAAYNTYALPLSKEDRRKVAGAKDVAASCTVKGTCECTPQPGKKKKDGNFFSFLSSLFN